MRRFVILVVALMLVGMVPAAAITGGQPDGDDHRAVGALVGYDQSTGKYFFVCSGSLIGDREFLTAAHCAFWETVKLTAEDVFVTFDSDLGVDDPWAWGLFGPVVDPENVIGLDLDNPRDVIPGYWVPPSSAQSRLDVAVLHVAGSASATYHGIKPVDLPEAGFLTDAAKKADLVGHQFTNVGYGFESLDLRTWSGDYTGSRMTSTSTFLGLTKDHLVMRQSLAAGDGGVCIGDSGGPNFFAPIGEPGGNLAVALNAGRGSHGCGLATNESIRLDVPEIVEFLRKWR